MTYIRPTGNEILAYREATGKGIYEARRALTKQRMIEALGEECTLEDLKLMVEAILNFL